MNYKLIFRVMGRGLIVLGLLLLLPFLIGLIYGEGLEAVLSFLIPSCVLILMGLPLSRIQSAKKSIYVREGFVIVALFWLLFSLVGALPFVISGVIPNYLDAFFESVSGFTTTGFTVLTGTQIEQMQHCFMFWRQFTHWLGGMGVLVFVIAILPDYSEGMMHVFRAESPGPMVEKLVSKIRFTARILYGIYIALTIFEVVLLVCGGMSFYESLLHSFSTAGTGGFSVKGDSIGAYNSVYIEMVIAVFMVLFSLNFNIYFLILIRNFSKAFKSEEIFLYIILIVIATLTIAINLLSTGENFWQAIRYSFFQVSSVSSTTGFSTTNIEGWPALSKLILIFLSCVGSCAGSTGGGIKVARLAILFKSGIKDIKKVSRPRYITSVRFEGQPVEQEVLRNVKTFFVLWCGLVTFSTIFLSIFDFSLINSFTTTIASIGNVGFNVGEAFSVSTLSWIPKIWISFIMLVGRLEIFPMIILFSPSIWKKN